MAVVFPYVKNAAWADGSGGGTPITAAKLNIEEDGIFNAHTQPCVRVTHNAVQLIPNNAVTTLAFNTERYDKAGGTASTMHDTVTNNSRLTAIYAGVYSIKANVEWASTPTVSSFIQFRLNGSTLIAIQQMAGDYRIQNLTCDWDMAVNDYVECRVFQNSGAGININATSSYSPEFSMHRVG